MTLCRAVHRENEHVYCDRHQGNHEFHSGFDRRELRAVYQDWPNEDYVPPLETPEAQVGQRMKRISDRFRAAQS